MEERYNKLRKELDEFGYKLPLVPDAVPLVEKITYDLIQTTDSLRRYMQIAKDALEERDNLRLGAEPYKCDNAKLVKECNDLHLTFLQFREQHENLQKDSKRKITILERDKEDLNKELQKLRNCVRDFELGKNIRNCNCSKGSKIGIKSHSASSVGKNQTKSDFKTKSSIELNSTMALAEDKINKLTKEVRRFKDEQLHLTEINESLKNQLINRDKEIRRLSEMLKGGRSLQALNQDCCFKEVDVRVNKMQDEVNNLQKNNLELENKLHEAVSKQHEAMKRALHLAERNKQLEKELSDIDQMALAVEAECNNTVKCKTENFNKMEGQLRETILHVQSLEREASDFKREKQELISDLDAVKLEKKRLQEVLETALDEKKRMTDKINQFTIIENDLNMEIDRLMQNSAKQKRKIAELDSKFVSNQFNDDFPEMSEAVEKEKKTKKRSKSPKGRMPSKPAVSSKKATKKSPSPQRMGRKKKPIRQRSKSPDSELESSLEVPANTPRTEMYRNHESMKFVSSTRSPNEICCNPGCCSRHNNTRMQSSFPTRLSIHDDDKCTGESKRNTCVCCSCATTSMRETRREGEIAQRQAQISCAMEHIIAEKDYYMKEYRRLSDQLKNIPCKLSDSSDLQQKLLEKEQLICSLQYENKCLAQEKHNLMTRLETARDQTDNDAFGLTLKSSIKRLERENELLRSDLQKLEEERDAVRHRLKMANETHAVEHARIEGNLRETQEELRKLEQDRRDIIQSQGSRRANLTHLEEQCAQLNEQLRQCQTDLNQQRALYSQLKTLHEQTDRSLSDSQGLVTQLERELMNAQDKINELEKERNNLDNQIASMKNDVLHAKTTMGKIDTEKDTLLLSLDDKTEKIVVLEQELKSKEDVIKNYEDSTTQLRRKISASLDDTNSREHILRTVQAETTALREELEAALRSKDIALQENRRIQEDLIACTTDCKKAHTDLEIACRQIDDLKRQLQTYVAEVKRTEDLISHKEIERSEMLDQFRSLSQEANALENNNHTLENEAIHSRVQLSVALDHTSDLERKLDAQDTMIRSYERQIAELTSQVASMEVQLTSQSRMQEKTEADLNAVRDLCLKLDEQKDKLLKQLNDKEHLTQEMDKNVAKLRRESETLQNTMAHDRHTVDGLEKLLAECRQENVDQTLINQELQAEIQRLKHKIQELHSKLSNYYPTFSGDGRDRDAKPIFNKTLPSYNDIPQEKPSPLGTSVAQSINISSGEIEQLINQHGLENVSKTNVSYYEKPVIPHSGDTATDENIYAELRETIRNTTLPEQLSNTKQVVKPSMFTFGRTNSEQTQLDRNKTDGTTISSMSKNLDILKSLQNKQLAETRNNYGQSLTKDYLETLPSKLKLMQVTSNTREEMPSQPYREADQKFTKAIQTTEIYKTLEETSSDQLYLKKGGDYEYTESCHCLSTCPCALKHQKPLKTNANQFNLMYTSTSSAPFNFSAHYSLAKAQLNVTKATDIQFSIKEK